MSIRIYLILIYYFYNNIMVGGNMNKQVIANLLELNVDELDKYTKVVDGLNATYYWNPERGGKMMIVGADG